MNTILITLLVVVALLALAFLGLAIQVMFKSDHKFPNMHIGSNKNLSKRGITCAQSWHKIEQKNAQKIPYEGLHLSND
ncbi:MAG: hypothetical protein JXR50_02735 [Prolixibacteraceae bacterium]|nr:hypothetical protein [Prolixibacteraceae bacterium]MBN2648636.1 hypothetical protein [Prolixibacteraceae bacterium]